MKKILQRHAIKLALEQSMLEDDRVLLIGEDIGLYGGAMQVTAGLYKNFSDQIIETPISESGICGLSIGLSLAGFKPVLEIMFMDFATQIVDQLLNQAVKFNGMYDGQLSVPMLVRTPCGGYKNYGATHSQSLENLFASIHDLEVVYPYSIQDYYGCLRYLIKNLKSPVLFIENKSLYIKRGVVDVDNFYEPAAKILARGKKNLIISYGQSLDFVFEAMNKVNENWTVIDLVSLKPLRGLNIILEEIKKHDKVVIVSESPNYASVAEHVAYKIQEYVFDDLKQPISIVASKDSFIPARQDKEEEVLLSSDKILDCLGYMI